MPDNLKLGKWNVRGLRYNNRCKIVKQWVNRLQSLLNVLCLRKLQIDEESVVFQLRTILPQGNFFMDVAKNGRVGVAVALPTGQVNLEQGYKGDGSLAWAKTSTSRDELFVASIYGDRRRQWRISLWN